MHIINIVDNLEPVNFGIWNAAIATAPSLFERFGITSEIWYPKPKSISDISNYHHVHFKEIDPNSPPNNYLSETQKKRIIITHGAWRYPTRWGYALKKQNIPWIYVPHGMLEPWSRQQKWLRKKIYFAAKEKPMAKQANYIRAVGSPEKINLGKHFQQTLLIPNGVEKIKTPLTEKWNKKPIQCLFMARLHYKKGIVPLVEAWIKSKLANNKNFKLVIAGPDQGELNKFLPQISACDNIDYRGAVYGAEKTNLLAQSHIFILPSVSEGFPTGILEAMQYEMICWITKGCNFPEALEAKVAIEIKPEKKALVKKLNELKNTDLNEYAIKARNSKNFIRKNYTYEIIANKQLELYKTLV